MLNIIFGSREGTPVLLFVVPSEDCCSWDFETSLKSEFPRFSRNTCLWLALLFKFPRARARASMQHSKSTIAPFATLDKRDFLKNGCRL